RWWSAPHAGDAHPPAHRKWRRHYWLIMGCMFLAIALFGAAGWLIFEFGRGNESGVTTAYRSIHMSSGVSPLVPLIALLAGFYGWFWQALSGLALMGAGRPVLPALLGNAPPAATVNWPSASSMPPCPFPPSANPPCCCTFSRCLSCC